MKAIKIDNKGFYQEDIPFYEGKQTQEIILEPPPDGLWHPRWNGESWEEGLTPEEIAERQAPTEPPAPDYRALKEALAPLYREYLPAIQESSQAALFLNSLDAEINSAIPSELILEIKLKRLFDSISVSVEDIKAINLALKKSNFNFSLWS
jgi:hypothetical protein